jgi:hypothetical protein
MIGSIFKSDGRPLDWRWLEQQLLFIAFVIGVPFGIGTVPTIFRDGDVSWHIAAGDWIITHGRVPTTDPFSFTAAGRSWVATEWLAEIIYALTFRLAGYAGIAALVATALITLNAIVFFHLQRRRAALPWASLLAMNVVLAPMVMARPHVLAWLVLAGWTVLLLDYSEKGRPPPLWTVLLLVIWTNLHATFPFAALIGAAIAFDALNATKWSAWREWVLFALAGLVAVLANANGVAGFLQPFRDSGLEMLSVIGEWYPTTTHNTPEFFVILLLGLGVLLWRGVRIPIGRLALLLTMLGYAFVHMRMQSFFIITAACVIPPMIPTEHSSKSVAKTMILAAVPLIVVRLILPLTPPEGEANPRHLLAAIPPGLRQQPVFNGYTFGGPLILNGIRPYIDGRAEMYGDEFVIDYVKVLEGDTVRFNADVNHFHISWVMLPNSEKILIGAIRSSGNWHQIYSDRIGVIFVSNHPTGAK